MISGAEFFREEGFLCARQLPSGEWIGVKPMMFTAGLFAGLDEYGYRTRFCYETIGDAIVACDEWNGEGDPPGMWIKQKPEGRMNPEWLAAAGRELGSKSI